MRGTESLQHSSTASNWTNPGRPLRGAPGAQADGAPHPRRGGRCLRGPADRKVAIRSQRKPACTESKAKEKQRGCSREGPGAHGRGLGRLGARGSALGLGPRCLRRDGPARGLFAPPRNVGSPTWGVSWGPRGQKRAKDRQGPRQAEAQPRAWRGRYRCGTVSARGALPAHPARRPLSADGETEARVGAETTEPARISPLRCWRLGEHPAGGEWRLSGGFPTAPAAPPGARASPGPRPAGGGPLERGEWLRR